MDVSRINQASETRITDVMSSMARPAQAQSSADSELSRIQSQTAEDRLSSAAVDLDRLESSAEAFNKVAEAMDRTLDFTVHRKSDTVVVKVMNKQTDEVIREVPAEDFLNFVDRMHDFLGLMFDEKA